MTNSGYLKIIVAQIELTVGDLETNKNKILQAIKKSRDELHADIVLFPELCITGYPPEDLLIRDDFHEAVDKYKQEIVQEITGIDAIISFPCR